MNSKLIWSLCALGTTHGTCQHAIHVPNAQLFAKFVCNCLHCKLFVQDESSRIAMSENQIWHPLVTLIGLLTCAVPVKLKAAILHVLAAFAKTQHIASALWQSMEMAQVI
jgi:Nuclear pore complex scaffold, nucleoporins 186/192/205